MYWSSHGIVLSESYSLWCNMRFTTDQVIEMNMRLLESDQIIWVIKLNILKLRSLDCSNIFLQRRLEFSFTLGAWVTP
jgi:hypothetical protein